jgi:hypothetical protein
MKIPSQALTANRARTDSSKQNDITGSLYPRVKMAKSRATRFERRQSDLMEFSGSKDLSGQAESLKD